MNEDQEGELTLGAMTVLLFFCVCLDLFQGFLYMMAFGLTLTGIGAVAPFLAAELNWFVVVPFGVAVIWMIYNHSGVRLNPVGIFVPTLIEIIPVLNALPGWTAYAVYTIWKSLLRRFALGIIAGKVAKAGIARLVGVILK